MFHLSTSVHIISQINRMFSYVEKNTRKAITKYYTPYKAITLDCPSIFQLISKSLYQSAYQSVSQSASLAFDKSDWISTY